MTAGIRNLWGEEQPATFVEGVDVPGGWAVAVPALGTLLVARLQSDELIVRLGCTYRSALVQGTNHVERDVKVVGDDLEVELLPNSSGEDRIVVVLHGAAENSPDDLGRSRDRETSALGPHSSGGRDANQGAARPPAAAT